ncbi:hypothetical protein FSS13T_18710 [Flavobacterium saliperosum S13]|uniref:Uncharacterized protein n=1 Tax=Flavobacterium saliperosum S13 TaxID=1341155 RepID=A0ABP2ZZ97_9FLAO|nr:hypothetical protein FSS13T_18710 [Flavobacterium saliperosum S13]
MKENLNFYARSASTNFSKKSQSLPFHKTAVVHSYFSRM